MISRLSQIFPFQCKYVSMFPTVIENLETRLTHKPFSRRPDLQSECITAESFMYEPKRKAHSETSNTDSPKPDRTHRKWASVLFITWALHVLRNTGKTGWTRAPRAGDSRRCFRPSEKLGLERFCLSRSAEGRLF